MRIALTSFQWAIFILTGSVIAPLSIGYAFNLPIDEIAGLLQRSFFIIGIGSILQILFGHRLPIIEGPAGVWWGVFLIYGSVAVSIGHIEGVWQQLALGLIISGIIFLVLGIFRLTKYLTALFTPLVTGIYMVLLVGQLSGPFITGMLGIGYLGESVHTTVAIASGAILIMSFFFSKSRISWLSRYSVLFSLLLGWGLFKLLGITKPLQINRENISFLPEIFPFGAPQFNLGVLITVIISSLLLLTNLLASIEAVKSVVKSDDRNRYDQANIVMGINQTLAGLFTTAGSVPISATAGFIMATKMKEKLPFIIGAGFITLLSFFPSLMIFFASIPAPVGYATIFLAIANMGAIGLLQFVNAKLSFDKLVIAAIAMMLGFGAMFIPTDTLAQMPISIQTLLNNGLIIGVFVAILLEQLLVKHE